MLGKLKFAKKNYIKLLGITIDNELKFDDHIIKICRKANSKLSALSRLTRYLLMKQKKLLYMSFIEGQFKYCPITWMFCSPSCNNKINKLQGGHYMIPFYRDEILSRFAGIPAV